MRSLICLMALACALVAASEPENVNVVVIRATFNPFGTLPCEVPPLNEDTDGIGAWYVGAPCQRASENPAQPSCWEDEEDPCLLYTNGGTLTEDGKCPSKPCEAEYSVDITFIEPCVAPCDAVKCCPSGNLQVRDQDDVFQEFLPEGNTVTVSAFNTCACTEVQDTSCTIELKVECQVLSYWPTLAQFGYTFTCKKCQ